MLFRFIFTHKFIIFTQGSNVVPVFKTLLDQDINIMSYTIFFELCKETYWSPSIKMIHAQSARHSDVSSLNGRLSVQSPMIIKQTNS